MRVDPSRSGLELARTDDNLRGLEESPGVIGDFDGYSGGDSDDSDGDSDALEGDARGVRGLETRSSDRSENRPGRFRRRRVGRAVAIMMPLLQAGKGCRFSVSITIHHRARASIVPQL